MIIRLSGNRKRSRLWGENEKGVILSNGGLATMDQGMCMSLIRLSNDMMPVPSEPLDNEQGVE